jgi:hypothetical protein
MKSILEPVILYSHDHPVFLWLIVFYDLLSFLLIVNACSIAKITPQLKNQIM